MQLCFIYKYEIFCRNFEIVECEFIFWYMILIGFCAIVQNAENKIELYFCHTGVCTQSNLPSVSSINRIIRNRVADRTALAYARMLNSSFYPFPPPPPPLWRSMLSYPESSSIYRPPRACDSQHHVVVSEASQEFQSHQDEQVTDVESNSKVIIPCTFQSDQLSHSISLP